MAEGPGSIDSEAWEVMEDEEELGDLGFLDGDEAAALLEDSAWELDPLPDDLSDLDDGEDDEDEADEDEARNAATLSTGERIGPGPHEVLQGECLADIAFRAGHLASTVWDHGPNADLRRLRKDPSFLAPGDVIEIPPIREKRVSCTAGKTHTFVRVTEPVKLRVRLRLMGVPRANTRYTLRAGNRVVEDQTDEEGWLEAPIPPDAREGLVTLESGEEIPLLLGGVDPLEEISGVQIRLCNLGYDCEVTGKLDEETRDALEAFQEDEELEVTGELEDETRARLKEQHGD
jgi:hypothetical protein